MTRFQCASDAREQVRINFIPVLFKVSNLCYAEIKPDIVFFGEGLPARFNDVQQADFAKCDLVIVMGTSLQVYPFAGLVTKAAATVPRLVRHRSALRSSIFSDTYGVR